MEYSLIKRCHQNQRTKKRCEPRLTVCKSVEATAFLLSQFLVFLVFFFYVYEHRLYLDFIIS